MNKPFNYENVQYLRALAELSPAYHAKYLRIIQVYLPRKTGKFLDVGCGNGYVLGKLVRVGYRSAYGIDVSRLFVKEARKKKLKRICAYDGVSMPFKDKFFDVVGSSNVLEHTQNPLHFLKEQIRVLRPGGYLIVACPNFLSAVMNSPHPRIAGIVRKIQNLVIILRKLMKRDFAFQKMPVIHRDHFVYDDDAVVVTNLLDLKHAITSNGCIIMYESGFIQGDSLLYRIVDTLPIVKYVMPSCFVVARKN